MSWLRFFRRRRSDAELQQEMDSFMAEEIAENAARGMTPEEAQRRARIKMGNPQRVRENLWQQNTVSALDKGWRDLKYSARTLGRSPGFSLIAIIVMALCIGAATSLFTIVRSVLLRPLPFRDPGKLVIDDDLPLNLNSSVPAPQSGPKLDRPLRCSTPRSLKC